MNEEMSPNSKRAQDDQFKPDMTRPDEEIYCWHCGGKFRMREMVFEVRVFDENGRVFDAQREAEVVFQLGEMNGFPVQEMWWCPNPKCDGRGFGFDLHTVRDYLGEFLDSADAQD